MTVLGFNSITVGYVYAQGVNESILGVASGAAGFTGIIGAFLFTRFRRCMGLNRTGITAFTLEILCLVLAVASVWTPGSPFKYYKGTPMPYNCSTLPGNYTETLVSMQNNSTAFNTSDISNIGRRK